MPSSGNSRCLGRGARRTGPMSCVENVPQFQISHPKKGIPMLLLLTEFEDRLFRYAQVEREGDIAIFTQELLYPCGIAGHDGFLNSPRPGSICSLLTVRPALPNCTVD